MPRLPTKSDFPSSLTLDIIPPASGAPLNILILLHGLGDTQSSFARLAANLALPSTAALALRAPSPIPALFTGSDASSFHWAADVVFDQTTGGLEFDGDFGRAMEMLEGVVGVLAEECGFGPREIMWLGFGQGGMVALGLCARMAEVGFGGVVSVGGRLPGGGTGTRRSGTPVLLCGGSGSRQVTRSAVEEVRGRFAEVEYVRWEKGEDSMPASREEMLPLMRFFARRLRSRAGVPDDALEV